MSQVTIMCRVCAKRWTTAAAAHCALCHTTFPNATAFDGHRRNGQCTPPTTGPTAA